MVSAGGVLEPKSVSPLERRLNVSTSNAKPSMVAPKGSAVMSRVEAFLTEFSKAQEELQAKPSSEVDMERVNGNEPHIEMILDCGMVDLLNESAVQAAEHAMASGRTIEELCRVSPVDPSSDSDDSESDGCDSEGDKTDGVPESDSGGKTSSAQRKRRKLVEEL